MGIPEELKKLIRRGDYQLIAEMYKEVHEAKEDFKTVSSEYVQMVVDGERVTKREGTAADEILMIATKLLTHRRDFIDELITLES
jgi:hypothetical protein